MTFTFTPFHLIQDFIVTTFRAVIPLISSYMTSGHITTIANQLIDRLRMNLLTL